MKKIIVISDSFKGTLSSTQIASIAKEEILLRFPRCLVVALPVADGGEGTVDCFLEASEGERISCSVTGPWGEPIVADYARIGTSAVIEMAAAAGLPLVRNRPDPSRTTTYGVGELIRHAVMNGAKHIVLGLGGSATNDGGCGCAAALGVKFYNREGQPFCPVGATLNQICDIDASEAHQLLSQVSVDVMCDINNPLCGPNGAACVFAPQKGADPSMVAELDANLSHMAAKIQEKLCVAVQKLPGGGAAGGFGAGAAAFLGGNLRPGIDLVLDMIHFEELLPETDLVITGEGRIDGQSLGGKVPIGVAKRAKAFGVPVIAVVGSIGKNADAVYDYGITEILCTNRAGLPFPQLIHRAADDYRNTIAEFLEQYREREET